MKKWMSIAGIGLAGTLLLLPPLVGAVIVYRNKVLGVAASAQESRMLAAPPPPLAWPLTLKVVTFNIQDLWVVGQDRPARMRHIARVLNDLDPDIVGFQESFIGKNRAILLGMLQGSRLRYHQYYPSRLVGSGLLISSAFPIREVFFHRFAAAAPFWRVYEGDWMAGKGVALARIETPAGMIDFFNTHAQADYGWKEYGEIRRLQMIEAADFINRARAPGIPAFFVGDLNCRIGDPDYESAIAGAHLLRLMNVESNIDHILAVDSPEYRFEVLDTTRIEEKVTEGGRTFALSDHPGFMSVIRIVPVNEETSAP